MHVPSRLCDWLPKAIQVVLMVSALATFIAADVSLSEVSTSVDSIMSETVDLVVPSAKVGDADSLLAIAIRQAKVRSCEKAQELFRAAIELNEKRAEFQTDSFQTEVRIGFYERLVAAQRRAGCTEETKYAVSRLLALYQQKSQNQGEKGVMGDLAVRVHNLQFQLDRGYLHLSLGDFEAAQALAATIIGQIRTAQWRPSVEFERAAAFLARIGLDQEAFEVVNRYDQFFESQPAIKEDRSNTHWWIYRVSNLAAVAEAQAQAGKKEGARATLRQAIEKVRHTPVARLTQVYGIRGTEVQGKLEAIGEGEALQSAGAMRIVWHAAQIGETDLALEAFKLASPLANKTTSAGVLIAALAKKGDLTAAKKLLDHFRCRSRAITRGLLERQDWAGAIRASEDYQKTSCCERECNFVEGDADYWAELGKARTFEQGEERALTWARNQPKPYKIYGLLGVVDGLTERSMASGNEK